MEQRKVAVTVSIFFLFAAILLASIPITAWAQGGATGAITGTVIDRSGGLVPNASIQVIDTGTQQASAH